MRQDFETSSRRRIGIAFGIAANLAVGGLMWYAYDQNVSTAPETGEDTVQIQLPPAEEVKPDFENVTIAPPTPMTITLTNGYGLHFADKDDLFNMRDDMINHSYYDPEYDRYHDKPPELHAAFLALEQITPLPYQAYEAAAWKETRLQPNTVNASSGAAGYFQMKNDAFYEALYFMRDLFPEMSDVTALIERERATEENNYTITYHPTDAAARDRLGELVHDPLISGMAYYAYLDHYMRNYVQEKLPDLQPNQTDYYLISFRGPGGAATFLEELHSNPDEPAHDMFITDSHPEGFTHPFVKQNKSVYFDAETEQYRTYQEVYDYIADDMGIGRASVTPGSQGIGLATIVDVSEQDRATTIPTNALIFAENIPRPVPRPDPPADDNFSIANGPPQN